MPLAEERLNEKVPFDVYAVTLVVTALITIGAILMLNAELRENWGGADPVGTERAEHLTKLNGQTDEDKATHGQSEWIQVTEEDKRDHRIMTGEELETPEYPAWMDVNKTGVKFLEEIRQLHAFDLEKVPAEERESMKSGYTENDPTAGVMEEANP